MPSVHELMHRLHCGPNEFYQVLAANFRAHGMVIASDRGAMIAIPEDDAPICTATPSKSMELTLDRLHTQFVEVPQTDWRDFSSLLSHPKLQDLEQCPNCRGSGWMTTLTCSHCNGMGEHHSCGEFDPCYECQESGKVETPSSDKAGAYACETCKGAGDAPRDRFLDRFCNIPLPGTPYCFGADAKYVRLLAQLPGAQWAPPQRIGENDCGAIFVRFDQGWGAIMPLREWQSHTPPTKPATERAFV